MKKILNFILHRLFFVVVMLLIQIIFIILVITKFQNYVGYLYFLMEIVGILVTLKIINSKSNPSYKIAWIIPVLTIPIFGTLFYLIFAHKPNKRTNKRLFVINEILSNNLKQDKNIINKIKEQNLLTKVNSYFNNNLTIILMHANADLLLGLFLMLYYKKLPNFEFFIFLLY